MQGMQADLYARTVSSPTRHHARSVPGPVSQRYGDCPKDAKEAAWQLHLENTQLRRRVDDLRTELARQRRRADNWENRYQAAAKRASALRKRLYEAQIRNLAAR